MRKGAQTKIQVYLSPRQMKEFKLLAERNQRTVSSMARILLIRETERKDNGTSEKEIWKS